MEANTPPTKSLSGISLNFNEVKKLTAGEYFDLPVKVSGNLRVGAISLIFIYPGDLVDVISVKLSANSDEDNLFYKSSPNSLRIGWFENNDAINLNNNDELLYIRIRIKNNFTDGDIIRFALENNQLCELANELGDPLENVNLFTYSIEHLSDLNALANESNELNSLVLYPNPAKDNLQIRYHIVNDGFVKISLYNILGEKVTDS